jgi:transposase
LTKKYIVCLSTADRSTLEALLSSPSVRRRRHARLLLDADRCAGRDELSDQQISDRHGVSVPTVARLRQRYVQGGLEAILAQPPVERHTGLSVDQAARLRALAAEPPPAGSQRWSLRQLADAMVARQQIDTISHETVRRVLKAGRQAPTPDPHTEPPGC